MTTAFSKLVLFRCFGLQFLLVLCLSGQWKGIIRTGVQNILEGCLKEWLLCFILFLFLSDLNDKGWRVSLRICMQPVHVFGCIL